jgi:glycosyltransferase involved in cell wall biosynthesis
LDILHINRSDFGGAASAVHRLHKNFLRKGYVSRVLVEQRKNYYPHYTQFKPPPESYKDILWGRIRTKIGNPINQDSLSTDPKYHFYNRNEFKTAYSTAQLINYIGKKPDIIILHWVSGFLNAQNIYELSEHYKIPVLWHLLDMGPMTGGCHYSWDCNGYQNKCGNCPALESDREIDRSRLNLSHKLEYLSKTPISFISTTDALDRQIRKASVAANKSIHKIFLSIDPDIFRPVRKESAREILGVPQNKKVIFFGAEMPSYERKGIKYLNSALKELNKHFSDSDNLHIITAGLEQAAELMDIPFDHQHLGFLSDDRSLAMAYQAADLFVCPSVEDSGPMMINESIMSGTPVVSFEIGVAPDLVLDGETGFKAKVADSADFAKQIQQFLLSKKSTDEWQQACRSHALQHYHPDVQVQAFEELIADLNSGSV